MLAGFDVELLVEAAGISRETAEKLQGRDDQRGSIVRVEHELRFVRPERREEEEEREEKIERGEEEERERRRERGEEEKERGESENGVEEGFCNLRLKEKIEDPPRSDVYNPQAGWITSVNGQKLPVPKYLQLSAERGGLSRISATTSNYTCRGISGTVVPGCPESFQQFQQQSQRRRGQGQRSSDQHQRINHFREGDILALPAGVVHWAYNDGDQPVVAITVVDTGNNANQLDRNHRQFLLAGRKQRGQRFSVEPTRQEDSNENIFNGFETESLAEVMGISRDLAEKLKGRNDNRGEIIRVEEELRVIRPSRMEREEYEEERRRQTTVNGLEQAFCSLRIKENIDDPERADIYNPNAGRITHLNSKKLPILRYLQLNAEKGVVRPDALISPHWNVNAHAIVYISRGSARFQIVGLRGNTVHNNEVRQGQVVVVPQHFATLIRKRAKPAIMLRPTASFGAYHDFMRNLVTRMGPRYFAAYEDSVFRHYVQFGPPGVDLPTFEHILSQWDKKSKQFVFTDRNDGEEIACSFNLEWVMEHTWFSNEGLHVDHNRDREN
ncbi:uncharacterized protein A4U43_C08F34690 [Asparagus officinalis]|nr:uncharacterized protein A4U43_C08F34690 [Asparagus officinalis]